MANNLNYRALLAMIAISKHGSALKASEAIGRSQPALTAALSELESEINVKLFDRNAKGMTLTNFGEILHRRTTNAFAYISKAEQMFESKTNQKHGLPLLRNVTQNQLKMLSALVETGSFNSAARALKKAEPTIHRSLRDLEAICGIPLWQRNGARIEIKYEAQELARLGELCETELEMGLDEIKEQLGLMEGSIKIGSLPLARSDWLPQAVANIIAQYPYSNISIIDGPYEEQLKALRHGKIDFILGALRGTLPSSDIEQKYLFSDPLSIVVRASHPFAKDFDSETDKLTIAQLASLGWILPRHDTPARDSFEAFMHMRQVALPNKVIECSSLVATRALLLKSEYAALLSARQIKLEIETGLLKIMGPPLTGTQRSIGITTRKNFSPTKLQNTILQEIIKTCEAEQI